MFSVKFASFTKIFNIKHFSISPFPPFINFIRCYRLKFSLISVTLDDRSFSGCDFQNAKWWLVMTKREWEVSCPLSLLKKVIPWASSWLVSRLRSNYKSFTKCCKACSDESVVSPAFSHHLPAVISKRNLSLFFFSFLQI